MKFNERYNHLIDAKTAQEFGVSASWRLMAQPQTNKSTEGRLVVQGGKV